MIIKVNNNGIKIDVSASDVLTEKFGTPHAVISRGYIAKLKIDTHPNTGEVVELIDKDGDEYTMHYSLIVSINGDSTHSSNKDVFDKISLELFGF